jgi:histidyl-tRNA synthetase
VPSLGAEKQVCGGGEYSLDELFNLKDVFCSGFAIGFDRLLIATELEGLTLNKPELDIYLIPLTEHGLNKAIELTNQLRAEGFKVEFDIKGRNMSKNLKFASTRNTKYSVFIGDDELKNKSAKVRGMVTGEQTDIGFDDIIKFFKDNI